MLNIKPLFSSLSLLRETAQSPNSLSPSQLFGQSLPSPIVCGIFLLLFFYDFVFNVWLVLSPSSLGAGLSCLLVLICDAISPLKMQATFQAEKVLCSLCLHSAAGSLGLYELRCSTYHLSLYCNLYKHLQASKSDLCASE